MRRLEDLSEEEVQEIQRGMDAWRESQIRPFKEPRMIGGKLYEYDSAWKVKRYSGANKRKEELESQGYKVKVVETERIRTILRNFLFGGFGDWRKNWFIVYKRSEGECR